MASTDRNTFRWYIEGSGTGYCAAYDRPDGSVMRVGPWSSKEKAQEYINQYGSDTEAEHRAFQYSNFDTRKSR